jgi:hypothetical protein
MTTPTPPPQCWWLRDVPVDSVLALVLSLLSTWFLLSLLPALSSSSLCLSSICRHCCIESYPPRLRGPNNGLWSSKTRSPHIQSRPPFLVCLPVRVFLILFSVFSLAFCRGRPLTFFRISVILFLLYLVVVLFVVLFPLSLCPSSDRDLCPTCSGRHSPCPYRTLFLSSFVVSPRLCRLRRPHCLCPPRLPLLSKSW